jgi:acyl-CoA thioester hydrolase
MSLLADYPIHTSIPVQWGEMDLANHINNVVYLRWVESGRMDYLRALDLTDFSGRKQRIGVILGAVECKYLLPLSYPDTVVVGTRVTAVEADRFIMESAIMSEKYQKLAAVCKSRIVAFDYRDRKKATWPEQVLEGIREIEGD